MIRIKELRLLNGWTQEILADKIKVKRNTLCDWELERTSPGLKNLIELAQVFEVTVDYLLDYKQVYGFTHTSKETVIIKETIENLSLDNKIKLYNILELLKKETNLKDNLKKYRQTRGLTQDDLAKELALKRHTIGDWETNRSEPSISDLKKLADYFYCSINDILGVKAKIIHNSSEEINYDFKILALIDILSENQKELIVELINMFF